MEPLIHLRRDAGVSPTLTTRFVMDLAHVESLITPRTVGIIAVHLYGHPMDNWTACWPSPRKHKLWVIEDCAQAQGAKYKGKTVGSMGDFGAFSFFPSKNLTVLGDGGCIVHEQRRDWPTACGCCAITAARANMTTNSPATTCASTKSTPPSAA